MLQNLNEFPQETEAQQVHGESCCTVEGWKHTCKNKKSDNPSDDINLARTKVQTHHIKKSRCYPDTEEEKQVPRRRKHIKSCSRWSVRVKIAGT